MLALSQICGCAPSMQCLLLLDRQQVCQQHENLHNAGMAVRTCSHAVQVRSAASSRRLADTRVCCTGLACCKLKICRVALALPEMVPLHARMCRNATLTREVVEENSLPQCVHCRCGCRLLQFSPYIFIHGICQLYTACRCLHTDGIMQSSCMKHIHGPVQEQDSYV